MLNPMKSKVIPTRIKVSLKIYSKPTPLSIMDFTMMINHLAGMMLLITCIGNGIEAIGKIKPERIITGSINPINEIIMAVCWVLEIVEIKIPNDNAVIMNKILSKANRRTLPLIGIPKMKYPMETITIALIIERKT